MSLRTREQDAMRELATLTFMVAVGGALALLAHTL